MDRALRERVIGAVVLVICAVLIVPIFLDGPADDSAIMQQSIKLPDQSGGAANQKTIVLDRDREQPVPAALDQANTAKATPEVTKAAVADVRPTRDQPSNVAKSDNNGQASEATVSAAASNVAVSSSTGMWAVQLGSFSNQENAERLAAELRKKGFAAFLSQLDTGSGKLHRVRIGPQKNRASAEVVAAKLSADGQKGQVVPHP